MSQSSNAVEKENRKVLRLKAKAELERLETIFSNDKIIEKIDRFKDTFAVCEIVYKVILEDHQLKKTGKHTDTLKINMNQVTAALSYAGYDFDKELLTKLFGSEGKRGSYSAKKLRNALTHGVKPNDVDELLKREEELLGYMNQFLDKIRHFDD